MTRIESTKTSLEAPTRARRIVVTPVGSLGDLHPYIAIALGSPHDPSHRQGPALLELRQG
jgi:hypothetical protein